MVPSSLSRNGVSRIGSRPSALIGWITTVWPRYVARPRPARSRALSARRFSRCSTDLSPGRRPLSGTGRCLTTWCWTKALTKSPWPKGCRTVCDTTGCSSIRDEPAVAATAP
ncbi:hypothetical protein GCM10023196_017040 [Actinoallomurus vinaceus]|uniref:Uncharacterized protein n=1 Tax=Actinoallomurus vinaceus TaxID=1080074 RepID=A0ABP8U4Z7_9ACTN